MSDASNVRLRLDGFKPMTRNTLRGFATVTIEPLGLIIEDVHIHQAPSGAPYALLPSKAQIKADGSVIRRDDGKIAYTPVLKFANREANDRFSLGVVELVRRRFPEVLPS